MRQRSKVPVTAVPPSSNSIIGRGVGRTVSAYHSTARRRVEAALSGTLPLTELTPEERLVANAETDAAISERLRTVNYGDVLAGEGVVTVALDDNGHLVRYEADGTTTRLD